MEDIHMRAFLAVLLLMGAAVVPQGAEGREGLSQRNFGTYMGGVLGVWAPIETYQKEVPYAKDLNIGITRLNTDCWDELEPSRGKFTWDKLDRIVDLLRANDIDILFTVPISAKWNASGGPVRVNNFDIGTTHFPAKDPRDIEDFCFALASHFKGRIKYYEAWNEPAFASSGRARPTENGIHRGPKEDVQGLEGADPDWQCPRRGSSLRADDTVSWKGRWKNRRLRIIAYLSASIYTHKSMWDTQRALPTRRIASSGSASRCALGYGALAYAGFLQVQRPRGDERREPSMTAILRVRRRTRA
jgi:hypothetical protein